MPYEELLKLQKLAQNPAPIVTGVDYDSFLSPHVSQNIHENNMTLPQIKAVYESQELQLKQ